MKNTHGGKRKGAGRPKGSTNEYPFKEMLLEHGEAIVQLVIRKALDGDRMFLKLCLERLVPSLKSIEVSGSTEAESAPLRIIVS